MTQRAEQTADPNRLAALRPRTVWDIGDDAFDLYRSHFTRFASVVGVVFVPTSLLIAFWTTTWLRPYMRNPEDPSAWLFPMAGGAMLTLPLTAITRILYTGAAAAAVEDILSGRNATLGSVYRRTFSRFFPLIGGALIVGLISSIGLCGTQLVYNLIYSFFAFVPMLIMLEKLNIPAAISRSQQIVSGQFGRTFGLLMLLSALEWVAGIGIGLAAQGGVSLLPHAKDLASVETRNIILTQAVQAVGTLLAAPITPIAMTLLYYDLRVRREGLDMEAEAAEIGFPLAPDAFGGVVHPKIPKGAAGGAYRP